MLSFENVIAYVAIYLHKATTGACNIVLCVQHVAKAGERSHDRAASSCRLLVGPFFGIQLRDHPVLRLGSLRSRDHILWRERGNHDASWHLRDRRKQGEQATPRERADLERVIALFALLDVLENVLRLLELVLVRDDRRHLLRTPSMAQSAAAARPRVELVPALWCRSSTAGYRPLRVVE